MIRGPNPTLLLALSVAIMLGCSQSESEPQLQPRVEPVEPAEPEPEPEPEPIPETVIEIDGPDEPETTDNTLSPTTPDPLPAQVEWRELAHFDEPLRFVYFASGVLARSDAGLYQLDERGGLAPTPALELPATELLGRWPDDVWTVTTTELDAKAKAKAKIPKREALFEHQLMHLDEHGAWVPANHRGKPSFVGTQLAFHKSWRGGMLVRDDALLTPIGARGNPSKIGPRMGKRVIEVFEARAGDLYTVSARAAGYYVQGGKCSDFACVEERARKLPHGTAWTFGAHVPRHHHGLSILAEVEIDEVRAQQLLHCGINGWTLESLVDGAKGLWSTKDGGLWLSLGEDRLWFRDAEGGWHEVGLPRGASAISAALVEEEGDELWLAANVGGQGVVFATAASGPALPTE